MRKIYCVRYVIFTGNETGISHEVNQFTSPVSLEGERPTFPCGQCSKTFERRYNRDRHIKAKHTGHSEDEGSHRCRNCFKSFSRSDNLKRHENVCSIEGESYSLLLEIYRCDILSIDSCYRLFTHNHTHFYNFSPDSTFPFHACAVCHRTFKHEKTLSNHLVTCMGRKRKANDEMNASAAKRGRSPKKPVQSKLYVMCKSIVLS